MCSQTITKYGINPLAIQWKVVRGDTAKLKVQFLELDEKTEFDTAGWSYKATTYDSSGDILDDIPVSIDGGTITLTAPASLTKYWGSGYKSVVAELAFDLQVTIQETGEDTIWTPIVGTVCVIGDITPGGSL